MRAVRKFLARHVWLLFLLILGTCVGGIALILCYPIEFILFMGAAGAFAALYAFVGMIMVATYYLYMKWSLEE